MQGRKLQLDPNELIRLHWGEMMSLRQMEKELGAYRHGISDEMKRHGILVRGRACATTGGLNHRWVGGPKKVPCATCGKEVNERWDNRNILRFCSRGCYAKSMEKNLSPEHRHFVGSTKWKRKAQEIRERDGMCCVRCGFDHEEHVTTYGGALHVHHIESRHERPDLAFDDDNLVTLCWPCHMREDRRIEAGNRMRRSSNA